MVKRTLFKTMLLLLLISMTAIIVGRNINVRSSQSNRTFPNPSIGKSTLNSTELPKPHFEVTPNETILGPQPTVGETFQLKVDIKNLHFGWNLVEVRFRLSYNLSLVNVVSVVEGDYLPRYAPYGTNPTAYNVLGETYGSHIFFSDLILSNPMGEVNFTLPGAEPPECGTLAVITFSVLRQSRTANLTSRFEFIHHETGSLLFDKENCTIPCEAPANGTCIITTNNPGRVLDIYTQYQSPYGGQGSFKPSDIFGPREQVELYGNVTYNYWPIPQKDVAFEVRDPHGDLRDIITAWSDVNGVAHANFRMPWLCDDPESLFGTWTVTGTVSIGDIVVADTLTFRYDYRVEILSVTTDKHEYRHGENVKITIAYGTYSQQTYPLMLYAVIKDELDVPIGITYIDTTTGGSSSCQRKDYSKSICTYINFAYAGIAEIYVTAYGKLPDQGGYELCPTYGLLRPDGTTWPAGSTLPTIIIWPHQPN